ncbi:MAG: hypothetical protein HOB38_08975 [Deltaproteobacteria bacterium]|jgi:hypothetical protein|nr:hypothetical protein [Deltaproteobacteria bacterium]MBT4262646.1 hypothetical protein [Deltaproteobacteria bacterium]MBT4641504.1 hypothetical protein [Deltaproteobacteria bacterium]MBT6612227.1 hypothetical protein [Deltaproteobacteria bacterium]
MAYDQEKYRKKREKILGTKKKRGLSFTMISTIVSIVFILGLSILVIPRTVEYVVTRNLDDVIYKLESQDRWPHEVLVHVSELSGVEMAIVDRNSTRLVITFDRNMVDTDRFASVFRIQKLGAIQLNRMNHRQRVANLKEEESLETL